MRFLSIKKVENWMQGITASSLNGRLSLSFSKMLLLLICSTFVCQNYHQQHGFMKSSSAITNLLEVTSAVIQGCEMNLQADVIYTVFSKAFNCVNHSPLVRKLNLLGFPVEFFFVLFMRVFKEMR